jgi:hypothetical protein
VQSVYVIPLLIAALGSSLLVLSTSGGAYASVLGLPFSSIVLRGLGLIVIIFSVVAFLAAYGSTLPPLRRAQHDKPDHVGGAHGKSEDSIKPQHLSRGA